MARRWQVQWDADKAELTSPEQVEDMLDRLTAKATDRPMIAVVLSPSGKSLSLGLGRNLSVVEYQMTADPPYFASVGNPSAHGLLTYEYSGEETEFEMRHAVPIEAARRAVAEFLKSDERPVSLNWEEV